VKKRCAKCGVEKPLGDFHRQPSGSHGRHSYCKTCYNKKYRGVKRKPISKEARSRQNLKTRYGLEPWQVKKILEAQGGVCAICKKEPKRACVDHDHKTGKVRGILCHQCNIKLPFVEDSSFRKSALGYLKK
jgi:hypothetical protein